MRISIKSVVKRTIPKPVLNVLVKLVGMKLFDGNSLFNRLIAGNKYSLKHLNNFVEDWTVSIQRDEALLLYALVRTVDPRTIVEFGFFDGHSAVNFLEAMSPDAKLYSYDISVDSRKLAKRIRDQRFRFVFKSQTDFAPSDIDNRTVNLVFFDASHDFNLNVVTFEKVKGQLHENALIIVHDTGAWHNCPKDFEPYRLLDTQGYFLGGSTSGGYIHMPGERRFVNYIKENMPDFDQIHFHSTTKFRDGLTILQRNTSPLAL